MKWTIEGKYSRPTCNSDRSGSFFYLNVWCTELLDSNFKIIAGLLTRHVTVKEYLSMIGRYIMETLPADGYGEPEIARYILYRSTSLAGKREHGSMNFDPKIFISHPVLANTEYRDLWVAIEYLKQRWYNKTLFTFTAVLTKWQHRQKREKHIPCQKTLQFS